MFATKLIKSYFPDTIIIFNRYNRSIFKEYDSIFFPNNIIVALNYRALYNPGNSVRRLKNLGFYL